MAAPGPVVPAAASRSAAVRAAFGGPAAGGGGGGFLGRGRGNRLQGSTTYTFGGSALDAAPYPLRGAQATPDYTRQQFGGSVGGPLKIPGVYDGARTTYFVNYNGGRSDSFVDQYATVPTAAMRAGDFSGALALRSTRSRASRSPNGRIPGRPHRSGRARAARLLSAAQPAGVVAELPASRHAATTTDGISLRLTHNFTATPPRGQGGRGGVGGGGAGGAAASAAATPSSSTRRCSTSASDSDAINVFPLLGGANETASFSAPIQLNVLRGRTIHNVRVTATHSHVAGADAILGGARCGRRGRHRRASRQDPFDWGVPSLSFAGLSGLRGLTPTRRADTRLGADYTFTRPLQRHTLRLGGGFRRDISDGRTVSDARGAFVFTGLYSAARPQRLDFADFLLGHAAAGLGRLRRGRRPAARSRLQPVRAGRLAGPARI